MKLETKCDGLVTHEKALSLQFGSNFTLTVAEALWILKHILAIIEQAVCLVQVLLLRKE